MKSEDINFENIDRVENERLIAHAFFNNYGLFFNYYKSNEEPGEKIKIRRLENIVELKYNNDEEILVCGYIDRENNFRKFFLTNMSDVSLYKKISV